MDFTKEVNDILKEPIDSKYKFEEAVEEIKKRMKCKMKHKSEENSENFDTKTADFFYRGDKIGIPLQPKLFFNVACLKAEGRKFREKYEMNQIVNGESELHFLCRLQHCGDCTRLLDFSTDPLVALRFACGRNGENGDKRVTMIYTDHKIEREIGDENVKTLMKMIRSDNLKNFTSEEKRQLCRDYFIVLPDFLDDIERCRRQSGAFLFPGNFKFSNPHTYPDDKVTHKLSEKIGRGNEYRGFIVNIEIKSEFVEKIRNELEGTKYYSINYLMDSEEVSGCEYGM